MGTVKDAAIIQEAKQAYAALKLVRQRAEARSKDIITAYAARQKQVLRQMRSVASRVGQEAVEQGFHAGSFAVEAGYEPTDALEHIIAEDLVPAVETLREQLLEEEVSVNGRMLAIQDALEGALGELMDGKLQEQDAYFRSFEVSDRAYLDQASAVLWGLHAFLQGPAAAAAADSAKEG